MVVSITVYEFLHLEISTPCLMVIFVAYKFNFALNLVSWVVYALIWPLPLYFRAGEEMKWLVGVDGPIGAGYDGGLIDTEGVLQHHGFTAPKWCRWPSFTKSFSLALAYGHDKNCGTYLVYCRGSVLTKAFVSKKTELQLRLAAANLDLWRYADFEDCMSYAHYYMNMDGGVYISNEKYLPLFRIG